MIGKAITAVMAMAGLFSACCLDSANMGRFLIVCVVSALWCAGYAALHGYIYTE